MSTAFQERPYRWSSVFGRELPVVMSKREAAGLLRVSPRTLNRYVNAKRLKRLKLLESTNGAVRFNLSELERFVTATEGR